MILNFSMFGAPRTPDMDRISRISAGLALVLAAAAGLFAAWWVPHPDGGAVAEIVPPHVVGGDGGPPVADLAAIIRFCAGHTTGQRGFVVFGGGSVVLVPEPEDDPAGYAVETLRRCATPEAVFVTGQTDSTDLVVTFTEPVFQWVPGRQRQALAEWAERNLSSLFSPAEQAKTPTGWTPGADARVGLVARSRLLADAKSAKVVKIVRPAQGSKRPPPREPS